MVETKFSAKFPVAMDQTSVGGCVVEVCVCKVNVLLRFCVMCDA